jgi:hypothetical protein
MATVTGVLGGITLPENTGAFHLNKWVLNTDREIHDISSWINATNAREKIGGMYEGNGSFEGFLSSGVAAVLTQMETENSAGGEFVCTATTGRTYTFDGIISNYTFGSEKVGLNTISGTFVLNGAIVIA